MSLTKKQTLHFRLFNSRLQDEAKYNNVWSEVRKILSDGNFPVSTVGTIPGKDEATYSWTTVNKLFPSKVFILVRLIYIELVQ